MKYLITGGAGFIGSNLAHYLLEQEKNSSIIILDDFSTGTMRNIDDIRAKNRVDIINDSVLNYDIVYKLMQNCDFVYHFASSVGVKYILDNPIKSLDSNIIGSRVVFEIASKLGKRVIFSSSSEVYGKNTAVPYYEDDDKIIGSTSVPRWSYSIAKSLSEYYAIAYSQVGLNVDILRFFNIVGPKQIGDYGMVLPNFINKALKGEDIVIHGDGTQKRCFTYVNDVTDICYLFSKLPNSTNSIYNVGNNVSTSINELADLVIETTKSNSKKIHISYEQAYGKNFEDCMNRCPSIDKLLDLFNGYEFTNLETIIRKIVEHINKNSTENII